MDELELLTTRYGKLLQWTTSQGRYCAAFDMIGYVGMGGSREEALENLLSKVSSHQK